MIKVHRINHTQSQLLELINNAQIRVYTDVLNPLLGRNGFAHVYGPQKGANS